MSGGAEARPDEAVRWSRFAHEDLWAAETLGADPEAAARLVCTLAQPAAEKALKALLVFRDVDPPRTHNVQLLADLVPRAGRVAGVAADLARLSLWAVESRYPGDWPEASADDAEVALAAAREVVLAVDLELSVVG